jgi:hypothetical protein
MSKLFFFLVVLAFWLFEPVQAQSLDLRADSDNVSTMQSLSINRTNIKFDTQLGATGTAVAAWRATIKGNPSGATFSINRTVVGGTAPDAIIAATRLYVEDGAGAVPFTPNAKFAAGVALTDVSETRDTLGTAAGNGVCRFQLKLVVNAQSYSGAGTINTTLFIVGALNP